MSELGAEVILPGHGPLIYNNHEDRCSRILEDTATFLEDICKQVLELMNSGVTLSEIHQRVNYPRELLSKPYLLPHYDSHLLIPNSLWRKYAGYWDGEIHTLRPVDYGELSREISHLFVNENEMARKISQLHSQKKYTAAIFLSEMAIKSQPKEKELIEAAKQVFEHQSTFLVSNNSPYFFCVALNPVFFKRRTHR